MTITINKAVKGKEYPPVAVTVERGWIKEFARAIGDQGRPAPGRAGRLGGEPEGGKGRHRQGDGQLAVPDLGPRTLQEWGEEGRPGRARA